MSTAMLTGRRDETGGRYHRWEELDELEYVAGDDMLPTARKHRVLEHRGRPPVTK